MSKSKKSLIILAFVVSQHLIVIKDTKRVKWKQLLWEIGVQRQCQIPHLIKEDKKKGLCHVSRLVEAWIYPIMCWRLTKQILSRHGVDVGHDEYQTWRFRGRVWKYSVGFANMVMECMYCGCVPHMKWLWWWSGGSISVLNGRRCARGLILNSACHYQNPFGGTKIPPSL